MSQSSQIYSVATWVSPYSGVVVDFYRSYSFHAYYNPSAENICRLTELIACHPDTITVMPWLTSGIVGWQADIQREPQMEEVACE